MPAEYARSGFHSGETASGYFDESLSITIGGTDRTKKSWFDTLEIEEASESPNTLHLGVRSFTPTKLQEIKIFNGGVDVGVPIYCGHLLGVKQVSANAKQRPRFDLVAADYWWLLDRYALVTQTYPNIGINAILARVIADYTDGGFTVGSCDQSLGNVGAGGITFTREKVSDCVKRLARAAGAQAKVDYQKRVSIFTGTNPDDEGNTLSLTNASTDWWDLGYVVDPSGIRTRVIQEGGGSALTEAASPGDTTIGVDELGWYPSTPVPLRAGTNLITYTGVSAGSGPGTLTGVSGIASDIAQGDTLIVYAQVDDAAAQAALSTLLGGLSGISTAYFSDGRLSYAECLARASAQLAQYKSALETLKYTTTNPYTRAGRMVSVSLTTPTTISASLRIQQVTIKGRHKVDSGTLPSLVLDRIVTASPAYRNLEDDLQKVGVGAR